jgi:hypothetical protein
VGPIGRDLETVARGVDRDRVGAAWQVDAPRQAQRAAAVGDGEDQQRVAAPVGDVAEPGARAGDARRADAGGRAGERRVPGTDRQRARAAVDDGAQPGRQRRGGLRRPGRRREPRGRAAAREREERA